MSTWVQCAYLRGTKSLDGRLIAQSAEGLPFLLHEGMEVHFVPPVLDAPRHAHVSEVVPAQNGDYIVRFDEVDSKNAAKVLVGCYCLCESLHVEGLLRDVIEESLQEYTVISVDGTHIGISLGVENLPQQSLLHVKKENGKEVLIPYVDAFIDEVNHDAKTICVDVPTGLLELEY
jgi:16S rRNA processing protein RimM